MLFTGSDISLDLVPTQLSGPLTSPDAVEELVLRTEIDELRYDGYPAEAELLNGRPVTLLFSREWVRPRTALPLPIRSP